MSCPQCPKNRINFSCITKESFNQFDNAMNYFRHSQSFAHSRNHAKQSLTRYLAVNLGVDPHILTSRILETVQKINEKGW
jgi:hypothetical protein